MTLVEYNKQRPKVLCEKCNGYYTKANIERHKQSCNGIIKVPYKASYIERENLNCIFCNKLCKNKNSLAQHEARCAKNPDRKDWDKLGKYSTENRKDQTKETNTNIALVTQKLLDSYKNRSRKSYLPKGTVTSIYKEHNDQEIQKYLAYVKNLSKQLPEYSKRISNGYVLVSNLQADFTKSIIFEHELICLLYLNVEDIFKYTIHHINHIRDDNRIENLMIFNCRKEHLQFHKSKYCWLSYNPETHIFSAEIRK